MINFCILSGRVCDDPKVEFEGKDAFTSFDLAIWAGLDEATRVKITCPGALASVAAKFIHEGDRLVAMGWIQCLGEPDSSEEWRVMRVVPLDLALVRNDSDFPW